jgi:parallel beta helix pectate lyase-like protein
MNTHLKPFLIVFGILFWVSGYSSVHAATYYVSPTGNNANLGTIDQPFATLQRAHDIANPGDTIYMRGGTYPIPVQTSITRSGNSGNPIKVFNYPGEVPMLDGSSNPNTGGHSIIRVNNNVSWWHFKGLEIKSSPGYGFYLVGNASNIIVELCNVHHNLRLDNSGGGINAEVGSNNLILNNDSHHNGHRGSEGGDGIALGSQGSGNIIRGNRIWRNNDDGLDLWGAANVLVENNWSWENGYDDNLQPLGGDGNGFKLGGGTTGDGAHTVRNNLAWRNFGSGFDSNSADNPMNVFNNTGYDNNSKDFNFYNVAYVLKNNLSYLGSVFAPSPVLNTSNSWNLAVAVSAADFVSLDFSGAAGLRNADGSLPTINFLKLAPGSDLIDKGVNVGIAFAGSAPDLGAFEYINSSVLQAPSNLMVQP